MKIQIDKLGVIDQATLEVGQLTVICGENNTGKTYVTYALYGFLRGWRRILDKILEDQIKSVLTNGSNKRFDLLEMFTGQVNDYLRKISDNTISYLPKCYLCYLKEHKTD